MRVALVAKRGPGATGTSRYAEWLRRELGSVGVSVDVAAPDPFPPWERPSRALAAAGLDLRAFFASYPFRAPLGGADLIHLTTQTLGTLLVWRRPRAPAVVTVLDIIPYLIRDRPDLRPFGHPLDAMFYRLALAGLRRADALIAISEYTRRTLIDTLHVPPERVHTVPLAVDHEVFKPVAVGADFDRRYGLPGEGQVVLYVGSDDPRKDLRSLLRAFALARARRPGAALVLAGPRQFPGARESLVALAAELGIADQVRFLGAVPDHDLARLYCRSDVLVLPSLYEGFGLPPLEAMACGTPVICASTSSLPEVVGDAGRLVPPSRPDELADGIVDLLSDQAKRAELSDRGRARAAAFTWRRVAAATHAVYRTVVS
jgi:glycosyltransferase involved in cell wall biosynthesis